MLIYIEPPQVSLYKDVIFVEVLLVREEERLPCDYKMIMLMKGNEKDEIMLNIHCYSLE
jgi:hypothetical protein